MSSSARLVLRDSEVVLRQARPEEVPSARSPRAEGIEPAVVSFVIEDQRGVLGKVSILLGAGGDGELAWCVSDGHRGLGIATRAVRLLVRYAFDELGLHRVEARVEPGDRASLRIAGRCGLRREGYVRAGWFVSDRDGELDGGSPDPQSPDLQSPDLQSHGLQSPEAKSHEAKSLAGQSIGERRDYVLLARLATDPEPTTSGGGFIAVLNAGLPTKRAIAQGLIRNSANEILLCELTYKSEWDLPGGVVDPGESPAHALRREVREEMQVQVQVSPSSLLAVNWLPPWHGWDDAMLFVFDLGVDDGVIARARLEPREVRALHWCSLDRVERHAAPYVTRMLARLSKETDGTAYLEDGADPDGALQG